jgi:hypothetical protein
MELWSNTFLFETGDWATCSVPLEVWRRITDENPGARLFGEFSYGGKTVYAALGSPNQEAEGNKAFVPSWMLDHLAAEGAGEAVAVDWLSQDAFPEATRIVLRPHDSAFFHADAKEELERALTRLGVVRQGDTIVIPLECLGEYEIAFDVVLTEPANLVLAQGDEVALEFEEALDAIAPPSEPPPLDYEEPVQEPKGQALGGTGRFMPNGERWNPWKHGPWPQAAAQGS